MSLTLDNFRMGSHGDSGQTTCRKSIKGTFYVCIRKDVKRKGDIVNSPIHKIFL